MFKVFKIEFTVDTNGDYVLRWYFKLGRLTRFNVSKAHITSPIQVKDMLNIVEAFANKHKTIKCSLNEFPVIIEEGEN